MSVPLITPDHTRLGWIGTGVMGRWMCQHLLQAGYAVTVFNRTPSKLQPLIEAGAQAATSPRQVAETSDVIITMLGYPEDVRDVILGSQGVLAGCQTGNIVVDMTTSQPELAVEIAKQCAEQGVHAIDAPVSGGDIGAQNGTLSIMLGGEAEPVNALTPLWEIMGKTFVHQGPPGAGQHTKMVNQTLVAAGMVGVCEALLYAQRAGLDLSTVLQSVSQGAAGSWALSNLGPRIIDNQFDPGFFVEHFVKDMKIALQEAQQMGLEMPGLQLAQELYQEVVSNGHARLGTHALQLSLAKKCGIDWEHRESAPTP